jgi:folylpolyglutamate synthase/dihydrofolate synthase
MNNIQQTSARKPLIVGKQRSYNEIVDYLDQHWSVAPDLSLDRARQLDKALDSASQKVPSILVGGTNGKSLTVYFASRLLKEEGLKVGAFTAPHILMYNERFTLNTETISNKAFTELGNKVIDAAEQLNLEAHSSELLVVMALQFFKENNVDVAIFEVQKGGISDPANIIPAKIATITRITPPDVTISEDNLQQLTQEMAGIVKKGTTITSGDQNKTTLQLLQTLAEKQGGVWAMPIRKLANLPYPFEQLHGRCAALAERIAQMFVEQHLSPNSTMVADSLLCKPKGMRGRPTLEAKRHSELNPRKTIEQFWREEISQLPGKFQLLDKEKPSILLDTASNIDSFKNLLLGIRLLHYQRPLKGLTIIVGAAKNALHSEEFLKQVRYFFKKTSGQIFICALDETLPGTHEEHMWDVEQVANDIKGMKVKARACKNFEEAFELAKKSVDERHGLVAITGSTSIVNAYWKLKGIKKF